METEELLLQQQQKQRKTPWSIRGILKTNDTHTMALRTVSIHGTRYNRVAVITLMLDVVRVPVQVPGTRTESYIFKATTICTWYSGYTVL